MRDIPPPAAAPRPRPNESHSPPRFTIFAGNFSAKASAVSKSTLNVRRSREFTPIRSQPASSASLQLIAIMHFTQNIESAPTRPWRKGTQLLRSERRHNQQDCIRGIRPRLQQLEFIHNKIFAQAGNRNRCRSRPQIFHRPLKKFFIRQHRKRRRARRFQFSRQLRRMKLRPNQSLRRRRLLQFRNDRNSIPALRLQPRRNSRGACRSARRSSSRKSASRLAADDSSARSCDNLIKKGRHNSP